MRQQTRPERDALARRWEQRLAVPVLLAAAVAIPAVFLTMLDHPGWQLTGHALNWASLLVLSAETVVLLALCGDKRAWLRHHKWSLLITIVAVPAVIYAIAPVQALRLLTLAKIVGTLRILRANTLVNAGRVLARRLRLPGRWRFALIAAASALAAGFVALVLVDPTAAREHRLLLQELRGWLGAKPALVAGLLLAAVTFLIVLYRRRLPTR